VVDWSTSRPVPAALVSAALLPDSLVYRGLADSTGHFSLGPLPAGDYIVTGVLDQNQNLLQDFREAYASNRLQTGKSDAGELWTYVHDTTAARIQTVTVDDSVSATIAFSQKLDPRQRLTPRDVRLRLLPDSAPVQVGSILPKPVDDSLNRRATPRDTTVRDTTPKPPDSLRLQPKPGQRRGAAPSEQAALTSRPPLFDQLVLRVPRPWRPGSRLAVELRGVRNVTGVAGNPTGVVAVPEKPKPTPADTTRKRQPADSTHGAQPRRPTPTPPPK
jgi:hypothetical protein